MGVSVPCDFYLGVPEPPRDLLYGDALIDKHRSVGMPEVVYAEMRQTGGSGVFLVTVLDRRISQYRLTAADTEILRVTVDELLTEQE